MKHIILILGAVVAVQSAQHPKDRQIGALKSCIGGKPIGRFAVLLEPKKIPINNVELNKALECFWRKLQIIKDDNTINYDALRTLAMAMARVHFGDADDFEEQFNVGLSQCKDMVEKVNDPVGLKAMKVRNCLLKFAEDHQ